MALLQSTGRLSTTRRCQPAFIARLNFGLATTKSSLALDASGRLLCRGRLNISQPFRSSRGRVEARRPTSFSYRPAVVTQHQCRSATTTGPPEHASSFPQNYVSPSTGLLSFLPSRLVPYAELSRLDKPVGTYYLLAPCMFSLLLAAPIASPMAPPTTILSFSILFTLGALTMRGAGCTINDLWDRRLDAHVARTRLRPLARGAVTPFAATVWLGAQCFLGLAILLQFPSACFWYATPSLLLVALYPAAKRVTNYPQAVLGLTFSWGAIVGLPALGVDLVADEAARAAAGALYASCVAWTVLYDMVYAHMDIRDDEKVGIKSIARRHESTTKLVLTGLAGAQAGLLALAGWLTGAGWVYHVGTFGAVMLGNGLQIWRVELRDPANCWWWFRKGVWITGGGIVLGMSAEYIMQYLDLYEEAGRERATVKVSS